MPHEAGHHRPHRGLAHPITQLVDDSDEVDSRGVGDFGEHRESVGAQHHVVSRDPGGEDLDPHLSRSGHRHRLLDHLQDIGTAATGDDDAQWRHQFSGVVGTVSEFIGIRTGMTT